MSMSEPTDASTGESTSERVATSGLEATGSYETAGDVVLYDTERPLAWIQGDNAVELPEMV